MGIKQTPRKNTVEGALSDAYSTLEELRDAIGERVENMGQHAGLSATSAYSTLEETKDGLDSIVDDQGEWSDSDAEIQVQWTEDASKKLSNSKKRDNAVSAMDAAMEGLRSWADEQETEKDEDSEDDDDEDESSKVEDARELADKLEEQIDTANNLEFPGTRG